MLNAIRFLLFPFLAAILVTACSSAVQRSPLVNAEPAVNSIQTRAPRVLRLYFQQLPEVPASTVTLIGPGGELNLRGLHTMGANDLMMEIYDEVENGEYTVQWQTSFSEDAGSYSGNYSGNYSFTVHSQ